jgi:hypothetical protein
MPDRAYMRQLSMAKKDQIDTELIVKRTFLALRDTIIKQIRHIKTSEAIAQNIERKRVRYLLTIMKIQQLATNSKSNFKVLKTRSDIKKKFAIASLTIYLKFRRFGRRLGSTYEKVFNARTRYMITFEGQS